MFWRTSSEIRPARAIEPPDGNSTVELAWRFFSPGIDMEFPALAIVIPPTFVNSLTSLSILRLMRPSESTVGVKATPTPNSLN